MTRLVNYGLGEVCDRVSILTLKILHGEAKGAEVAHFRNERNALLPEIVRREMGRWVEQYGELCAVNGALWYLEDLLRGARNDHTADAEDVVKVAYRIQELNDQRAVLIQAINAFVGDLVKEKV